MPAVLSEPLSPAPGPFPRREHLPKQREGLPPEQVACVLGGGGLFVYGLLRGSWSGLAVAAAGGVLLYRGLRRKPLPAAFQPPAPALVVAEEPVRAAPAVPFPAEDPLGSHVPLETGPDTPVTGPLPAREEAAVGSLTPAEHDQARVLAYWHALERGGGVLPAYDFARAVDDFCRAVPVVIAQRAR